MIENMNDLLELRLQATKCAYVFSCIAAERCNQDKQWGGPGHDDNHTVAQWADFIKHHTQKAVRLAAAGLLDDSRNKMLQVAALATAACQSMDRKYCLGTGVLPEPNPPEAA